MCRGDGLLKPAYSNKSVVGTSHVLSPRPLLLDPSASQGSPIISGELIVPRCADDMDSDRACVGVEKLSAASQIRSKACLVPADTPSPCHETRPASIRLSSTAWTRKTPLKAVTDHASSAEPARSNAPSTRPSTRRACGAWLNLCRASSSPLHQAASEGVSPAATRELSSVTTPTTSVYPAGAPCARRPPMRSMPTQTALCHQTRCCDRPSAWRATPMLEILA